MNKLFSLIFLLFSFLFLNAQESAPQVATDGTLTVKATVTYTSPYYYAVWLKNTSGTFLRTLVMYGNTTKYYPDLTNWYANSGANKVNATTGATRSASGTYTSTWNAKDQANSTIVDDGTYTVCIEMSSETYATNSKYTTTSFIKGTAAQNLTGTNVSPLSGITVTWTPSNTAVDEVKANIYSVYPNPTRSTVFVNGFDIQSIEVLTLTGKKLFSTDQQRIDLNGLPKGIYFVRLFTNSGSFIKKVEKL